MPASKALSHQRGLRPMEQTPSWTFGSALTLLNETPTIHILDALDEFLLHSKEVILSPFPFRCKDPKDLNMLNEFTLRGVLFEDVSKNVSTANKLARILHVDPKEALRVITQTQQRIPEFESANKPSSLLGSRLHDDKDELKTGEKLARYASMLLKERRVVLRIAKNCLGRRYDENSTSTVRNLGKSIILDSSYAENAIESLRQCATDILSGSYKTGVSHAIDTIVYTETLLFMSELLSLLCEIIISSSGISPVTQWFRFMDETNFMISLGSFITNKECFVLLQSLATVVSLQVLDLENSFDTESQSYVNDGKLFKSIDEIISTRNVNSIVNYAWLIILYKKAIVVEEFSEMSVTFVKEFPLDKINASIAFFTEVLESSNVFLDVTKLNQFLQFDELYSIVLSNLLMVALPLMPMNVDTATCIQQVLSSAPPFIVEKFYDNPEVVNAIVLSRAKFPVSIPPYLKLASINGNFAFNEFRELKSYMSVFDKEEFGRICDIDSENTDLMKLSETVDLYPPYEVNNKLSLMLSYNTKAKVIPTKDDKVLVTFLYKYSGWAFLGRVIQNISKTFDITDSRKMLVLKDLLHLLVQTSAQVEKEDFVTALKAMSAYTDDSDILEILFRLLEQGLHNRNTEISAQVIKILTNLLPVYSPRIWPYLAKSSLLPNRGKESFMSIMFGSIEMVNGSYDFTNALIKFIGALTNDCLTNKHGFPDNLQGEVLGAMIEHAIVVFESFMNCNFDDGLQRLELGILLVGVFTSILSALNEVNSGNLGQSVPVKELSISADKIIRSFLAPEVASVRSPIPIFKMIKSVADTMNYYDFRDVTGLYSKNWIRSALKFSEILIITRSLVGLKPSQFERKMFTHLQDLIKIYSRGSFRKSVLDLITALTSGIWNDEPMPSMLSHLEQEYSQIFLRSLAADLTNLFDDYTIRVSVYDLLCSILDANQEGLSVLFISGRNVFGGSKSETSLSVSLLAILKKNANEMKYYPPSVTAHLLDAIALAFNSWTIANEDNSDEHFVKEILKPLESADGDLDDSKASIDLISACYSNKVIAKSAEILSLILFTTKSEAIKALITDGLLHKDSFVKNIPKFLCPKLQKGPTLQQITSQFEEHFPNYRLSQFTSSSQRRNRFSVNAIYALDIMESLFFSNGKWAEMKTMLENWSARMQDYYSQVAIAKSVGALITALCRRAPSKKLNSYVKLIPQILSLQRIEESQIVTTVTQLKLERVELAFLVAQTCTVVEGFQDDGQIALDIIEKSSIAFHGGSCTDENTPTTQRALLRLAHIALSTLRNEQNLIISRFSILRDFFDQVVSQGSRLIIAQLQNDVYLSRTDKTHKATDLGELLNDLRLVISIFKCFVSFNIPDSLQNELANSLIEQKTVDSYLSLYSFSHLIVVHDEPIFSHLTLMFVQLLLSVGVFAEKFITRNMFMVIRESVISQPLREGGITIQNSPQLHRNWTNGIMPIISATLTGPSNKTEVFNTIKAFRKQIGFCIESWAKDSQTLRVSSAVTWETTQICHFYQILSSIAKAENISSQSPTSVDMYILPGLDTPQRREDFLDYINNLLKHPKFLSSIIIPSTPEETKVLKTAGKAQDEFVKALISEISELKEFFN
ncbi:hypothetical protein CJI97_005605 [Candidozyma auris]|nr:hypothetical protein CJI97_005605 [[Candida] auris]